MAGAAPARILALPCWQGSITASPLAGGLSNESWKVTSGAGSHVVRFGADYPVHHVSRVHETMVAKAAHAAGFAPAVSYAAPGVMVSAFIAGKTWEPADVRANAARVGELLRRFHTLMPAHVSGPAAMFWPFHVVRDYARTLREGDSPFLLELPRLLALSSAFEAAQQPLPVVFGHHDLLPANFLDDGEKLWLIDFEYAAFGTPLFDLAGAAAHAGMTDDEARAMLTAYFGSSPEPARWHAFAAMQGAALVREAMWAMVSDIHLAAPGADYKAHACENLGKLEAFLITYQQKHGSLQA